MQKIFEGPVELGKKVAEIAEKNGGIIIKDSSRESSLVYTKVIILGEIKVRVFVDERDNPHSQVKFSGEQKGPTISLIRSNLNGLSKYLK